jgi:hypothetical protein
MPKEMVYVIGFLLIFAVTLVTVLACTDTDRITDRWRLVLAEPGPDVVKELVSHQGYYRHKGRCFSYIISKQYGCANSVSFTQVNCNDDIPETPGSEGLSFLKKDR